MICVLNIEHSIMLQSRNLDDNKYTTNMAPVNPGKFWKIIHKIANCTHYNLPTNLHDMCWLRKKGIVLQSKNLDE